MHTNFWLRAHSLYTMNEVYIVILIRFFLSLLDWYNLKFYTIICMHKMFTVVLLILLEYRLFPFFKFSFLLYEISFYTNVHTTYTNIFNVLLGFFSASNFSVSVFIYFCFCIFLFRARLIHSIFRRIWIE